jgi:opacity protein-like surface antigen
MKLKHCFPLAAAAAAVLFGGAAQAQQLAAPASPWNAEIGYSWMNIRNGDLGFDASPQAIRGIVGYSFHPNFALEGMAAFGTHSDSDLGVDVKLRSAYGLFLKPKVTWNNLEVFGRLGYARTNVRASALGVSASGSDNDFAWGAGAAWNFNPRTYVSVDYMRLDNKDSTRVDGWTVNLGYRF